jgi:hypothetical protein
MSSSTYWSITGTFAIPEALPTSTSLLEIRPSPEELVNNQHAHQDDVEMEDVNDDMVILKMSQVG